MANIKELIQSIESLDSSFDEKLEALNQMEETLVAMRQQEQEAIDDNVDLIVEAINVMQKKVDAQLVEIQGIIPEKGDKGDKGLDGKQGKDGRDGKDGKDGVNGKDGADGKDGVSVSDAHIDFDGSLVITLSTGQEINVGEVVAPELQEKIKLVTSGGAGTVLPSQTGNANKYLKTDGTALSWATVSSSSGTVTSVGTSGSVNGITLTGGPITSSGTVTLGGTLGGIGNSQLTNSSITFGSTAQALGSTVSGLSGVTIDNGAIGATTASTGKFTTLISTGTATLSNGSTTYVQAIGDASYPGVYAAGGTNTPLVLQPLGTGALQAQKTDSTATGGNARGANAVDWQTARANANQVASGQLSFVGGGTNNRSTAYASTATGGYQNLASNTGSVISGGSTNTASGNYSSIIGGVLNVAAGYYNVIGGGYTNSATSGSAVTTQSGTMNGTTAVTLSGSNASIKVGQYITGTSIAAETYVAAISGTSLTLSQAASGSSTNTLTFYTPHGVVVGGGNNQATGSYSFIGGGGDAGTAANRNVASGDWSVVGGGVKNVASGIGSVIAGGGTYGSTVGNTASGIGSFIGSGWGNQATNTGSSVVTGAYNLATGQYSGVFGGQIGTTRAINGYIVFPSSNAGGSNITGGAQGAILVLGRQTTDATATVLTSDSVAAGGSNQVILPNNSAYYFRGEVVAGVTGAGDTKGWYVEGVIKRGAGVGTTAIVGTATVTSLYADAGAATWAVTALADTTNGGLKITVTGQASTTIRWVAQIRTTEMTY
jgi:hypothetical protein